MDAPRQRPSTAQMTLHTAVMENNIRMVFQLLNSGADINMRNSLFNTLFILPLNMDFSI